EVMRSLSSEFDLDRLLDKIMSCMTTVMQADRSTIFILDAAKHELIVKAAQGIEASGTVRIPANRGIVGHVVTTGEVVNIASAYDDQRFDPSMDRATSYRTKSLLAVPMRDEHGHVTGVVECLNKLDDENLFTADDAELLEALAAQAAVALRVARTVQHREAQLRQQVQELQIKIDVSKRAAQVSEIVQGDYFQELRAKAELLRARSNKAPTPPEAETPT
ncbi:MAG: GAF domain-containing protein, partial [Chloroflexi bacterium]|nr:GAF domain-containing protein [Chloroflexota bacterium]